MRQVRIVVLAEFGQHDAGLQHVGEDFTVQILVTQFTFPQRNLNNALFIRLLEVSVVRGYQTEGSALNQTDRTQLKRLKR